MREGLRSSSSKREDGKIGLVRSVGDLGRVTIPDLNLEDDPDDVSSEERGKFRSEVSRTDGKSNGVVCEKEGAGEDEGNGMEVEDEGEKYVTPKLECSRDVGLERAETVKGGEGHIDDVDLSKQVFPTRVINNEKKIDEFSENVGGGEKEAGVEGLKCSVDSDDWVSESPLAVEKNMGSEDYKRKVPSLNVSGEVEKKNLEKSPRSINGNCDGKADMEDHVDADSILSKDMQLNPDVEMEYPEKASVTVGIQCKFDEFDGNEGLKKEGNQERVQVAARVLRSRVVPANGLGEDTEGRSGFSQRKRKCITDGLREAAVVMENESSRLAVEKTCGSRKSKRSIDHSGNVLVEPNNSRLVSETEDENVDNKLIGSSERKRKRGRPKLSRNHPEKKVDLINEELTAVSKVEEDLDNESTRSSKKKDGRGRPRKSANVLGSERVVPYKVEKEAGRINNSASSKKKDGRGRPRKFANYLANEKAAPIKFENEGGDIGNRSVGNLTPRRISGRKKRSVDYSEEQVAQKKRELSFSKFKYEAPAEVEDKSLSNKSVRKSKKKGKRGRPRKEPENDAVKIICHENGKVKGARDLKVSLVPAPARRSRRDIHSPRVPEKPSDVVPQEEVRSDKKVNFVELDKYKVEKSSKGKETPLPENNSPAKRKRAEIVGSLSSEKNAIRNQIVEMLLSAGWTVEYRPRYGREYKDAVYVNREGKTHWSVTKAYNSLQQEVEEGKAGGNFTFNPLPAEVLSKLFRVVSKTRSDKNKKKKNNQDGDTSDEEGSIVKAGNRKAGAKQKHSALKRKPSVRVGAQGRRRCALVVRRSNQGSTSEIDGAIAHIGKHSVLAWMIDLGTVSLNGKVHYKNHHEAESVLEGSITRDGIHCCCCKEIISVSDFENHAGSKLSQPYENIYLESGSSLLQCLLDSWNKQDETGRLGFHGVNVNVDDPNDDTCAICGDGGDLMCCDGCPSTFHLDCLDIEELPLGEWHCAFCSCKFCGESAAAIEEVESDAVSSQLITCHLCEEKYHKSCISEEDNLCVESRRPDFCGRNCEQMSERLKSLLGAKCDLGDGYSWTLLQRSVFEEDSVSLEPQKIQNNSKLAVALSVMEECFLPIIDPRSGVNLIRHVIYSCGSNFNRLNFSSFLTVVLEKGDEVISAASIRIRGKKLAEMPFIGTRNVYRRKGMCRRLLNAIGQALVTLEVENLVIPAISELMDTWTSVFGFNPLEESVREEMRSLNMLVFAHTDMLQKPIVKQQFGEKRTSLIEKDADSGVSQNDQVDCAAVKTDADKPEIDDGCLNGKFDLNCVAPNAPDSSSDERCLVHPDSDAENCEDEVKSRMNYGDDNNNNDGQSGVADIVMNSSEVRTLHPDLNLMAANESISDEKSHGHRGSDIMNSDEIAKSTSNSSGLTNVKECCIVESDDDQNGDSTSVRSSEEKALNHDLNLAGKVLENGGSLPSNSTSVEASNSKIDGQKPIDHATTQGGDNLLEVTNCYSSQNVDDETGPLSFQAVGQAAEIKCSDVEISKAHDLGSNIGDDTAGAESLKKSTKCLDSESNSLVVCTRVPQVTSDSSCNPSSASGESCIAGIFHGSGIAKVGPTKS